MEHDKIAIIINTHGQLTELDSFLPHIADLSPNWFILVKEQNNYFAINNLGDAWYYLGSFPYDRSEVTFDEWKLLRTVGAM